MSEGNDRQPFDRVLALEAAVQRTARSSRRRYDASSESLLALAELLVLRRQWKPLGQEVRILGAAQRPVLRAIREVLKNGNCAVIEESVAGCVRLPPTEMALAERDEAFDEDHTRYLMGASRALQQAAFPDKARRRILGALGELLDNVFQHAGRCSWALSAFEVDAGNFAAVVVDAGEGIVAGYRRNAVLRPEQAAMHALDLAVLQHRSCTGLSDRGLGFRELMDALRSLDALIRVRSDDASLTLASRVQSTGEEPRLSEEFELRGFSVGFNVSFRP